MSSADECVQCILPAAFPGSRLDAQGVCHYCRQFKGLADLEIQKNKYRARFEALVRTIRGQRPYEALMCYSGGKDSTYALARLREDYSLRVLAMTVDNGFMPERTFRNIRNVVESLGADHLLFKPDFRLLRTIFRHCACHPVFPAKTLERASAICTACMAIVRFSSLRVALERSIPLVVYGWSPGQAPLASALMQQTPGMARLMQNAALEPLLGIAGDDVRKYFLEERHFGGEEAYPHFVNPLAFFDYSEGRICQDIIRLGWEAPKDTDANSTNCQLNSFSNQCHQKQYGFHPYAFEIAGLVRRGAMSREEGWRKLNRPEDSAVVAQVQSKLGM